MSAVSGKPREDELDVLEAELGQRREVVDHRRRVAGERHHVALEARSGGPPRGRAVGVEDRRRT